MKAPKVYLVAYYMMKPKHNRVNTSVRGWMDNSDNVAYEEQIAVTTKLKPKDINTAKIILDLGSRTVYRNGWGDNKSFEQLFSHFYSGYQKYLDPVIAQLGYEMVKQENALETATDSAPKTETISSE